MIWQQGMCCWIPVYEPKLQVSQEMQDITQYADFGLSKYMDGERKTANYTTSSDMLPLKWLAPEIFSKAVYSTETDMVRIVVINSECRKTKTLKST